jgi:hypothetical protein
MNRTLKGLILIIALSFSSPRTLYAENAPKYPDGETATEQEVSDYMNKQTFWKNRRPPNIKKQLADLNKKLKSNKFSFAIIGDNYAWAGALNPLLSAAKKSGVVLFTSVGDFLECGVPWINQLCDDKGVKRWASWEKTAVISDKFFQDTLHLPTLGDHEYGGRLVTLKNEKARELPFKRFWGVDTVNNVWRIKNCLFITMKVRHNTDAEWAWLKKELEKAKADDTIDHVFIYRHTAFYDIGKTGAGVREGRKINENSLVRKFKDYKVTATFGGHQHAYYRTVRDGVTHFGVLAIGASEYGQPYRDMAISGDSFFYVAGRNEKKDVPPPLLPGVEKPADGTNILRCDGKEFDLAEQGTKQLYRNYIMIIEVDGKKASHWLLHKNGKFKLGEVSLEPLPRRSK